MKKKSIAIALALLLLLSMFSGCSSNSAATATSSASAVSGEKIIIKIAGAWDDCRAIDEVANAFTTKYPNVTVEYEQLQDYYASLEKRLTGEDPVDLFFTANIQSDSELLPYALDLKSVEGIDFSNTFEGLIENFLFREESGEKTKLFSIPLGAELRGTYVNKTLLSSMGIDIPTDQASLLAACKTLKEKGHIAFHGNPGSFAQTLIYPWVCNLIANADDPAATYKKVNDREPGFSEMFREPMAFLYSLVENYYYDYKTAQTDLNLFTETTDDDYARDFLNIQKKDDAYFKADDIGRVAFMPAPMSLQSVIEKTKEDYHSEIEYQFVLSPVGVDGGYAYMSPAQGIAAFKDSKNLEWTIKFLGFLFQPESNELFAKNFNIIPNTKEAFSYITTLFDVPTNHISHLGQVTFDYGFYNLMQPAITDTSKANNPKYMLDDGKGNLSIYPLEHFMELLEKSLQEQTQE